jgi:hypothetical protein
MDLSLRRLGEGPKLFGLCNNMGLRIQRENQTRITCHGSKESKMLPL